CVVCVLFVFFFQAEDGIRDWSVTGVQTCALPICNWIDLIKLEGCGSRTLAELISWQCLSRAYMETPEGQAGVDVIQQILRDANEIGRASCRERVEDSVGAG